ncbi:mechanosensitive ion channel [Cyanobium sp. BA5m-21]|uniref:mechanosensitive ion channel family protein n=1 Tax=unclassified Cyanobium TaxID=2627006 RepID=UPI0020CC2C7F|nr:MULTISPECIES: mechanosensitive ion channel domain-containing protein [unclassified Cyanobium]MCP9907247.1 mechanosensitive ion channel [Cyanobium sp. BA5m-21]MCP9914353.1 mechanosensitive ion channel [Cyanobium sp. BA20m-14]
MRELLLEVLGWLGYLERPTVLLQLAVAIGLMVLRRFAARRNWLRQLRPRAFTPLALVVLAASCLLLALLGLPYGLSGQLGVLWLGWYGLNQLQPLLQRCLGAKTARQLESRLLRPGYLLLAALMLITSVDSINDLAVAPLGSMLGVPVDAGKLFNAALITYLVLVGSGPPATGVAWLVQRVLASSDGSRKALELMLRYTVVGLGLVAVGVHLGLNTTALIAVAGGLSVGLGFGIKEVFSNFISGIWLLFEGSVRPGEVLMLDGDPCEVRSLGLRATLLWRDRDNAELLIPNQTFFTQAATSYTASDRMRRSQVSIGAAYHHNPVEVIALLEATALEVARVLPQPAPKALLLNYGDSAINYCLRFWIANPMDNVGICSEVNQAIWRAFRDSSIEIPFPQHVEYSMQWPPGAPSNQ